MVGYMAESMAQVVFSTKSNGAMQVAFDTFWKWNLSGIVAKPPEKFPDTEHGTVTLIPRFELT